MTLWNLCALCFVRALSASTTELHLHESSSLVHLQPFVQLYVVILCLFYVYLLYLIKNAFG